MRHDFHGRFRFFDGSLYILVPSTTASYITRKVKGNEAPNELHGEPVRVEVEL